MRIILAAALAGTAGGGAARADDAWPDGPSRSDEAARPSRHHGHGRGFHLELAGELALTADQREQIRAIARSSFEEMKGLIGKQIAARAALLDAVHADTIDEDAIRQAAREANAWREDLAVARARAIQEVRDVLTPEQRETLKALRESLDHREWLRDHHLGGVDDFIDAM